MSKHKSVLVGLEIVVAGKSRRCYHNRKHSILKGDECLEIKEGLGKKGYCLLCAKSMVSEAMQRLSQINHKLQSLP